jgi:hypothetical protein
MYLIDAVLTETNTVKLKFLDENGKIREFVEEKCKPYFLTAYQLTSEDEETVRYFSGDVQTVEKTDLFTGEKRTLAKVSWPNSKVASKAAERFRLRWESEIDFPKSYVYDRGLNFGALHSGDDLKPILDTPNETTLASEVDFKEMQRSDPLKMLKLLIGRAC